MVVDKGLKKFLQTLKDDLMEEVLDIRSQDKTTWTHDDEICLSVAEAKLTLVKSIISMCEERGRY